VRKSGNTYSPSLWDGPLPGDTGMPVERIGHRSIAFRQFLIGNFEAFTEACESGDSALRLRSHAIKNARFISSGDVRIAPLQSCSLTSSMQGI
jgi:hypothetical protein